MDINYIKKLVTKLGFVPQNGTIGIYVKHYEKSNKYPVFIDFNEQKIKYAHESIKENERIRLGDLTTSNFNKLENFVVLECVDRLLEKGYLSKNIELEKGYQLGRNLKGKLDIIVYNENGNTPFLMIECKTWGSEFEKESEKTLKNGGQIFSYYQQDRAAKFLCLYTSRFNQGEVEYKNNIILVDEAWHNLSNIKDIYDYWNKNFKDNGIFEEYAKPYNIRHKALTYGMLRNLKKDDSGKIYHQIMEILRHNAISDKPNAFNKLLNLFVCKILDENQNPDDELKFQWMETDTDESMQTRLNDLYKEGMRRFLEIEVVDHSEEEIINALEGIDNPIQRQQLTDMFKDMRLKKNSNFAFIEVLDEKTFKLNSKIVREIVELLQVYKFRYDQKHEFLGNFFELLLNTSMKQEAGQFFTPVPITRFIISSLPLREFVQKKIDNRDYNNMLPVVIDYACGSGHFLTEYMEQMQDVIDNKINLLSTAPDIRKKINAWREQTKFAWAKDFVYGIDLDNRLVKTAKISAFFNGDGEANIIWANGLDNFERTEEYRGLLKQTQFYDKKNNGQFDILISNPPYSVEAFKSTLIYGKETFELYDSITDNSSEIECLFVERMKQLLKVGGWAGVILPITILSNSGIYSKAREILFKYFRIISIAEMGSGTFMKTGIKTVVLFLERRSDNDFINIEKAVDMFISNQKDITVMGIEKAFSKYVSNVYENLAFEDYVSFIKGDASPLMKEHELYVDYKKAFGDKIYTKAIEAEKEKMLYFLLTYSSDIVLIKTGEKQEEKNFLGYEFRERRGHEGIKYLSCGTKLFDENGDLLNTQKANSYIYNAFLGKIIDIDESMVNNVSYGNMSGFINYGTDKFDKAVNLNKKMKVSSIFPMIRLNEIADVIKGVTYSKDDQVYDKTNNIVVTADNITNDGSFELVKKVFLRNDFAIDDAKRLQKNDILVCVSSGSKSHVGKCAYIASDTEYFAGGFMGILRSSTDNICMKYLWIVLSSKQFRDIMSQKSTGSNINNISSVLGDIKVPVPPVNIQQEIITCMKDYEDEETKLKSQLSEYQEKISDIINDCFAGSYSFEQLGNIADIYNGGTPSTEREEYWNGDIYWATLADTKDKYLYSTQRRITKEGLDHCNAVILPVNTVLFSSRATIGEVSVAKVPVSTNQGYKNFVCNENKLYYEYLYYILRHEAENIKLLAGGMTYPEINKAMISEYKIPLPSLDKQQEIISQIQEIEYKINIIQEQLDKLKSKKASVLQKFQIKA